MTASKHLDPWGMTVLEVLVVVSSVVTALVGGVFFAFSAFVMRALAEQPAAHGVAVMQRINVTVITPLFIGSFLGALPLLAMAAYAARVAGHGQSFLWLSASFTIYLAGSVIVTVLFNVPRNNKLAMLHARSDEAAGYWPVYVRQWLFWNHVRCVASLAAAAAAASALAGTGGMPANTE
jgi:uncharacterized membrane protein